MPKKILEITMGYNIPAEELAKAFLELAPTWAKIEGLDWKIWVHNGEEEKAGGRYLFDSEESLKNYLDGELYAGLFKHPALKDIDSKVYDVLPEHTKITRGPI
jgi:hypothetical protein